MKPPIARNAVPPGSAARIGIGISYIPTRVHHIGPTRLSATLARGTDRYNHFDHEAPPQAELDEAALAVHADSQSRYCNAASGLAQLRPIHCPFPGARPCAEAGCLGGSTGEPANNFS